MIARKKYQQLDSDQQQYFACKSQVLYHLNTVCAVLKGMLLKFSLHLRLQLILQSKQKLA